MGAAPYTGAFVTSFDGTHNRLRQTGTSTFSELIFPSGSRLNDWTMTFRVQFANISNPAASYIYPGCQHQVEGDEYQIVLSRGVTSPPPGAFYITKVVRPSTVTVLGSPTSTYVGTSGTTFTQNEAYAVTVVASGTTTRSFVCSVQRVSDSHWLKSDGTWTTGAQAALSVSDSSSPLPGIGNVTLNMYGSALDAYLYDLTITDRFSVFDRQGRILPVLSKGGTFDGWDCDALGATGICWDGTRYVQSQSIWSIAQDKWANGFWTTTGPLTGWAQVPGSLLTPSGGDYLYGNGAIAWWNSKYWLAYTHYHKDLTNLGYIAVDYSTDLLTWTHAINPIVTNGVDAYIIVNPTNNHMELWYVVQGSPSAVHMWDTSDPTGASWTDHGSMMPAPLWVGQVPINQLGAPFVFYPTDGYRWLGFDTNGQNDGRSTGLVYSINQDTNWLSSGICLMRDTSHSWENQAVLDQGVIVADLGDGYGNVPRMLYGGSDNSSAVDDTNSSIGLATWEEAAVSGGGGGGSGHFATAFAGGVR